MDNSSQLIWNPFRRGFRDDPHRQFRLFRELNPVHRGINGYWFLFKYDDVKMLLTNPVFKTVKLSEHLLSKNRFLTPPASFDDLSGMVGKWLFLLDPPEHGELRGMVVKLWNQYQIQQFIGETVDEAVARLAANPAPEAVDDFAGYIPTRVMSKILGLPFEDYERLRRWSHYFANTFEPFESLPKLLRYNENAREVCEYMERLMERKKAAPDDGFISRFLTENARLARPVPHDDLVSLFLMLFFAGMETSIYIISQSVLALIENPSETERLRADLSLVPRAVEELVRYVSPLQYVTRIPTADVEIGGHRIRAGELVLGSIASANRDEAVFSDPDQLDFARAGKSHIGFGHGIHHCIGARLARDEMLAVLPALLETFTKIEFDAARPRVWDDVIIFRRLKSLPVVVHRSTQAAVQ